jgi:hypothetical protein
MKLKDRGTDACRYGLPACGDMLRGRPVPVAGRSGSM